MCLMGAELAVTTQQQNLRAELSCLCATISSVLGRGQKKQIECKELLVWEPAEEAGTCMSRACCWCACLSNTAQQGWPGGKRQLCNRRLCRYSDLKGS